MCLFVDGKGHPIAAPPLIREIAKHPVLSKTHLIAEPWDLGMYQVRNEHSSNCSSRVQGVGSA